MFYKLGRAGGAAEKVGAIDFATTIAPGVRDVLLIGKVYEASTPRTTGKRPRQPAARIDSYDAVVLDAPPTGRVGRFLGVNREVADLAKDRPDPGAGRLDHRACCAPGDARAHRHPAGGDARAGDRGRRGGVRAARLPVGAVVVNQGARAAA
jgi:anion-transporting  ArsA/GET3 family ATPase